MKNNKQSLYTKYRPNNFDQVIGQDVAKNILINSISKNKINHAYLFFGIRGTGKTTLARIFAKAVNCESRKKYNPCNKCETCKSINNGSAFDIIEIDAASNNGVDEIRTLKENSSYLTTATKYKVYIIDEVHMLTKAAFNALLKTLEEPPENTIFLLATTDIQKMPKTVLSRTIIINLEVISDKDIKKGIKVVIEGEGLKYDEDALDYITMVSGGSLRDAISFLETVLLYNEELSVDNVVKALGLIKIEDIRDMLLNNPLKLINEINNSDKEPYKISLIMMEVIENLIKKGDIKYIELLNNVIDISNTIKDPSLLKVALKSSIYLIIDNKEKKTIVKNNVSRETTNNNIEYNKEKEILGNKLKKINNILNNEDVNKNVSYEITNDNLNKDEKQINNVNENKELINNINQKNEEPNNEVIDNVPRETINNNIDEDKESINNINHNNEEPSNEVIDNDSNEILNSNVNENKEQESVNLNKDKELVNNINQSVENPNNEVIDNVPRETINNNIDEDKELINNINYNNEEPSNEVIDNDSNEILNSNVNENKEQESVILNQDNDKYNNHNENINNVPRETLNNNIDENKELINNINQKNEEPNNEVIDNVPRKTINNTTTNNYPELDIITDHVDANNYMYIIKNNDSNELSKITRVWKFIENYITSFKHKDIVSALIKTTPLASTKKTIILGFLNDQQIKEFKRISLTAPLFNFLKEIIGDYRFVLPINSDTWSKLLSIKDRIKLRDVHTDINLDARDYLHNESKIIKDKMDNLFGEENVSYE